MKNVKISIATLSLAWAVISLIGCSGGGSGNSPEMQAKVDSMQNK